MTELLGFDAPGVMSRCCIQSIERESVAAWREVWRVKPGERELSCSCASQRQRKGGRIGVATDSVGRQPSASSGVALQFWA
jgi:hypothetical protein